jgi:hypothetical protein
VTRLRLWLRQWPCGIYRFQPIEVTWRSLATLTELELNAKGQFVKKQNDTRVDGPSQFRLGDLPRQPTRQFQSDEADPN